MRRLRRLCCRGSGVGAGGDKSRVWPLHDDRGVDGERSFDAIPQASEEEMAAEAQRRDRREVVAVSDNGEGYQQQERQLHMVREDNHTISTATGALATEEAPAPASPTQHQVPSETQAVVGVEGGDSAVTAAAAADGDAAALKTTAGSAADVAQPAVS